jgi:hypothetical protein
LTAALTALSPLSEQVLRHGRLFEILLLVQLTGRMAG